MVVLITVVVGFEIFAIITVARSSVKKKWKWILLALVGVTRLEMIWGSGMVGYSAFSVSLFGFSATSMGSGPWVVGVSFPIGAILAIRKAKEDVVPIEERVGTTVLAAGQADHGT